MVFDFPFLDKILTQEKKAHSAANTTATEIEEYGAMPEMIDDFIRNYFANMGLYKTLGSFQEEWFELEHKVGFLLGENQFLIFISRMVIGSPNLIPESLSRAKMCC